jgi:hypothetical protein
MKLVVVILVGFFFLVSILYATYSFFGANDIGFILAFIVGLVGSLLAMGLSPVKFQGAKNLGVGMIGLALFFMIANLFGVPLVA